MSLSVPERHQLKIARDTMKMHCVGARIMGMTHHEAASIIRELTGKKSWRVEGCDCPKTHN